MAINFPDPPLTTGQVFTAGSRAWTWNGRAWISTSATIGYTGSRGAYDAVGFTGSVGYTGSLGESSYSYSTTAPSSPAVGDRWYDSNNGVEVVWTDDGTSTQWVEIAASGYLGQTGYTGSASTVIGYTGSVGFTGSVGAGFTGSFGFSGSIGTTIPVNTQASTYIAQATDNGFFISTSSSVTVDINIFATGQNFSIYNSSTSTSISIIQGTSVTMYVSGTLTTGNRSLATTGFATVLCVNGASNTFLITGAGLT